MVEQNRDALRRSSERLKNRIRQDDTLRWDTVFIGGDGWTADSARILRELDPRHRTLMLTGDAAEQDVGRLETSRADLLTDSEITGVRAVENGPARYRIETVDGLAIHADNVVVGYGRSDRAHRLFEPLLPSPPESAGALVDSDSVRRGGAPGFKSLEGHGVHLIASQRGRRMLTPRLIARQLRDGRTSKHHDAP